VATVEYRLELVLHCPLLPRRILNTAVPLSVNCYCVEFSWYLGTNAASFWELYSLFKVRCL
jgi:hypothetical protein